MKKRFTAVFFVFILVFSLCVNVSAAAQSKEENVIYFADGSYVTITLEEIGARASGSKTGKKTYTYTDSNGEASWQAVLSGTFTYTGTSATCTASDCDITIYESVWYVVSNTPAKSSNVASVALTMGRKFLGITIEKKNYTWSITCDKDGNLS